MMNNSLYSAPGFMPLSPLLCDADNSNPLNTPFLKLSQNPTQAAKNIVTGPDALLSEITTRTSDDKIAGSCGSVKSTSSSDNENTGTNHGSTVAVNKKEMLKLIEEQTLQKQRLLRKAEQARLSRKRKKMRMQELEKETEFLRSEVKRLKTALALQEEKVGTMAAAASAITPVAKDEYESVYKELQKHVEAGREQDANKMVDHIMRSFRTSKPDAQKFLEAFASRISPSLPVRFLDWILAKQDSFYDDKSGLWNSLFVQELKLDAKQLDKMKKMRYAPGSRAPFNKDELISKLGAHIQQQYDLQGRMLDSLDTVLKPEQLAKFLLWVQKFGEVCIKIR